MEVSLPTDKPQLEICVSIDEWKCDIIAEKVPYEITWELSSDDNGTGDVSSRTATPRRSPQGPATVAQVAIQRSTSSGSDRSPERRPSALSPQLERSRFPMRASRSSGVPLIW